jgi:signal transduction histidine kinase
MPDPFTFHPRDAHLLDVFAHDLRSPLLGMQGCLGELQHVIVDRPDDTEMLEDFAALQSGLTRIEALLTGLMTICRRSRPQLNPEPLDMSEVIADAIAQVEESRGPLSITVGPLPPCHADRAALTEAFVHLIDNAARIDGPIQIAGEVGERPTYTITDTGGGLSSAVKRSAFELFVSGTGGEGIGLSLARHLLILHRGWLRLHSTETGCRAEVSLPA